METKVHKILGKDLTVELKKPMQKTSVLPDHEQATILRHGCTKNPFVYIVHNCYEFYKVVFAIDVNNY